MRLQKGDFDIVLRLFASAAERSKGASIPSPAAKRVVAKIEAGKDDIKREGSVTRISKALADRLKADGNTLMSSIAIKPMANGVKVVAVDQGSIAQKMGITAERYLQEVNGQKLSPGGRYEPGLRCAEERDRFELRFYGAGSQRRSAMR